MSNDKKNILEKCKTYVRSFLENEDIKQYSFLKLCKKDEVLFKFDPDKEKLVLSIDYILWHECYPDFDFTPSFYPINIGGESLNTVKTLFGEEFSRIPDNFISEKELLNFTYKCFSLGNISVLPKKGGSINRYKGNCTGYYGDYNDLFLQALKNYSDNGTSGDTNLDILMKNNKESFKYFFDDEKFNFDRYVKEMFLEDYLDNGKVRIIGDKKTMKERRNLSADDYKKFAEAYMDYVTDVITKRTERLYKKLTECL